MQKKINNKYYFNQTDNYVEIIFDDNIVNCDNIFYNSTSITEINFYNFHTSFAKAICCMFFNCTSLISIDFSNFDASQVLYMNGMFTIVHL